MEKPCLTCASQGTSKCEKCKVFDDYVIADILGKDIDNAMDAMHYIEGVENYVICIESTDLNFKYKFIQNTTADEKNNYCIEMTENLSEAIHLTLLQCMYILPQCYAYSTNYSPRLKFYIKNLNDLKGVE